MTKPILLATLAGVVLWGCSNQGTSHPPQGSGGAAGPSGGRSGTGGSLSSGGSSAVGGASATGGSLSSGGSSATGGTPATGGSLASGGSSANGGASGTGGSPATGGRSGTGGTSATGGATVGGGGTAGSSTAGGRTGSGGAAGGSAGTSTGGSTSQGGSTGTGGRPNTGGSPGAGGGGGSTSGDGGLGGSRSDASSPADGTKSDASSTGGSGGYQPCPTDGTVCKILPLGDSITYGVNDEGNAGYRGPLFASAVAAGQKITFTGSLSNGPTTVSGQTFPKNNEGHSGWGISEVTPYSNGNAGIATVVPSPAMSNSSGGIPHIILLHIGTNDQGSFPATQMTSDLSGLLDKIIAAAPDALLVVAQIIPLGYGTNDVIKTYNQSIPGLVQTRAAAGKHVLLLDMYTGFNTSTMLGSDNIHPNSTGYKFMADHWYSAIGSLLPK